MASRNFKIFIVIFIIYDVGPTYPPNLGLIG
jgi:hypothetical protein